MAHIESVANHMCDKGHPVPVFWYVISSLRILRIHEYSDVYNMKMMCHNAYALINQSAKINESTFGVNMNKAIRKYDIAEYTAKGVSAIDKMMATQQAGKLAKGSKHAVIVAMRDKLKVAIDAGFTTQQIADALKDGDVFGVLPKMIAEIVKDKETAIASTAKKAEVSATKKTVVKSKSKANTSDTKAPDNATAPVSTPDAGSIEVTEDTQDL